MPVFWTFLENKRVLSVYGYATSTVNADELCPPLNHQVKPSDPVLAFRLLSGPGA